MFQLTGVASLCMINSVAMTRICLMFLYRYLFTVAAYVENKVAKLQYYY